MTKNSIQPKRAGTRRGVYRGTGKSPAVNSLRRLKLGKDMERIEDRLKNHGVESLDNLVTMTSSEFMEISPNKPRARALDVEDRISIIEGMLEICICFKDGKEATEDLLTALKQ